MGQTFEGQYITHPIDVIAPVNGTYVDVTDYNYVNCYSSQIMLNNYFLIAIYRRTDMLRMS